MPHVRSPYPPRGLKFRALDVPAAGALAVGARARVPDRFVRHGVLVGAMGGLVDAAVLSR